MNNSASVSFDMSNLAGLSMVPSSGQDVVDPDLFIGLPFELPQSQEASSWLDELDFIDPYTGDLHELQSLCEHAPSASARDWLRGLMAVRTRQEALASRVV